MLRILAIDDPKISKKLAFLGYWHKSVIQIFEKWSGCKIIKQNVLGGYDF